MNLFVSTGLVVAFLALSNGQDFDTNSCSNLEPLPGTGNVATGPPYILASSPTTYVAGGNPVQVFLIGQGANTYRSVLIQARRADNDAPVGSFTFTGSTLEHLDCGSGYPEATVISTNSNEKNLPLSLSWSPPPYGLGQITLLATIVDANGNIYLAQEAFSPINGPPAANLQAVCPDAVVSGNIASWANPTCNRQGVPISDITCDRVSGNVFPPGLTTVTCTCNNAGELNVCEISFVISGVPTNPCIPNLCPGGIECRETFTAQTGYTCHRSVGQPCV